MNNNQNSKILYGIGGIVLGLILGSTFLPVAGFGPMMGWQKNTSTNSTAQRATQATIDRHFIEQMIPHHEGAIAMANLALEKAKRPEIRALAEEIIRAQESENQQMKNWYEEWFGVGVPTQSVLMMGGMMSQGGMHMGGREDINVLAAADDFDKEFVEQMIPHHQMAIMMARMLQAGTNRQEMRNLADNIITSQSAEIEEMQNWYADWYEAQ